MPLASGTKLGPYEIQSPLGAGGMGEVYRAKDSRLGRDVAIKVLPESLARDAERLRRFETEARAIAALNHPNILSIHDIGTYNGAPYLVSECLEGQSLWVALRGGALPLRRVADYGTQIAQGLAAAHDKGIIHRDLKPENVFVTRDGRVKILDFGLAKLAHPEESSYEGATMAAVPTSAGVVLGTVGYMSPEHVRGEPADARSDIFSLGTIFVRNDIREPRLPARYFSRDDDRDPERGRAGVEPYRKTHFSRARAHGQKMPREKPAATVSIGAGFGVQS